MCSVTASDGQALSFLQEDKNDGAESRRDFAEGGRISRADGWTDGDVGMTMKMTQSNVNDNFAMLVPRTWNSRVACLAGKSSPYRQQHVR